MAQSDNNLALSDLLTKIESDRVACFCYNPVSPSFSNRYLIDSKWFKQWKKYVGFDSWDVYNMGNASFNPGPIDNSGLIKGNWAYM